VRACVRACVPPNGFYLDFWRYLLFYYYYYYYILPRYNLLFVDVFQH